MSSGGYRDSARIYDAIYSFKDYRAESARLRQLITEANPEATTLLDVACGTGAHLEYLAEQFIVEGIDLSEAMLARARERHPQLTFHHGDMRSFDLGRRFDAVTCLFSAVGHLGSPAELEQAVAAMAAHLAPGGVLIIEPWITPEQYRVGGLHALFVDEPELKIARMNRSERRGRLAVMAMHHLVGDEHGIEHFVEQLELFLFTHEEYLQAFTRAGLAVQHDPEGFGRGLYLGRKASAT